MKSVRRIAALILCAAIVFSTGISAASYGGAKHENVSSADESGLAAALTQKNEKAEPAKAKKPGTLTDCGGVFAAGDGRVKSVRQLTTAVGDGAVAGLAACRYVDAL